jgi:hypothetical protein
MKPNHHIAELEIRSIRHDQKIQQRSPLLNNQIVAEYAEAMKGGSTFPPVIVFSDGNDNWVSDGFHRLEAADEAGKATIAAEVRQGTQRDAILFAVGANQDHGLRRTREDVRRAIVTLLADEEWGAWSDRSIADKVGASHPTVAAIRRELGQLVNFTSCDPPTETPDEVPQANTDLPAGAEAGEEEPAPSSPPKPTKRIGKDGKARNTPAPKGQAKTPSQTASVPKAPPTGNLAKVAMDRALALSVAIGRLHEVCDDLLPEDVVMVIGNLWAMLDWLEGRFGTAKEGLGDA